MTASRQSTKAAAAVSPARDLLYLGRRYLGGSRNVLVLVVIAALVAIGLSWSWLVAAGVAPILLSTLPCLLMCGLGLCMNKLFHGSCASEPAGSRTAEPTRPETATNIVSIVTASAVESACSREHRLEKSTGPEPLDERRDSHA